MSPPRQISAPLAMLCRTAGSGQVKQPRHMSIGERRLHEMTTCKVGPVEHGVGPEELGFYLM